MYEIDIILINFTAENRNTKLKKKNKSNNIKTRHRGFVDVHNSFIMNTCHLLFFHFSSHTNTRALRIINIVCYFNESRQRL